MRVYGLIGRTLEHSFSKNYFSEKFSRENLNAKFELFPLPSISDLPKLMAEHTDLLGLAVTIPYKTEVIPFLNVLSEQAQKIGAVNCIELQNGKLIGHNTDAIGFRQSLIPLLTDAHNAALILGTGGAAKAVKYVLNDIGLSCLNVSSKSTAADKTISYADITKDILRKYPVIVNCTPLGMYPNEMNRPDLPYEFLSANNILYDLIYNPAETLFLKEGKARGCVVQNGLDMLILQAEENWKIWNQKLYQQPA